MDHPVSGHDDYRVQQEHTITVYRFSVKCLK